MPRQSLSPTIRFLLLEPQIDGLVRVLLLLVPFVEPTPAGFVHLAARRCGPSLRLVEEDPIT